MKSQLEDKKNQRESNSVRELQKGLKLHQQGRLDQAEEIYRQILHLQPLNSGALHLLGVVSMQKGDNPSAVELINRAIQIIPDQPIFHSNLGNAYRDSGRCEEAIACYQKALRFRPDYAEAYSYLIHQCQYICDWQRLMQFSKRLDELNRQAAANSESCAEPPFICMARHSDLSINLRIANSWSRKLAQPYRHLKFSHSFQKRGAKNTRLTVGYLSSDFHNHATAHLIRSLFGLHDRRQFKIYGYSYRPDDNSQYRKKIRAQCDCFIDIRNHSDIEAAQCIYEARLTR